MLECENCELSRITFEVLVERPKFIIYLLFTTHSYLCFEKSRSLSGKHIVIKLDAVTSLFKVSLGAMVMKIMFYFVFCLLLCFEGGFSRASNRIKIFL